MIDTNTFINKLIEQGYTHICVVPCSFAKDVINSAINSGSLIEYTPCASEAIVCSVAAGLSMAGEKPIVIIQSSGLTNMGSCITSLLKPYDVMFPIIVSWRTYNEGDSEIQHQHLSKKLPDLVAAYGYEHVVIDKNDLGEAINQINQCNNKRQICLLQKNTFSKVDLHFENQLNLSKYPKRSKYLEIINNKIQNTDTVLIGTTGNTSREMYSFMPDTNNFYMAGNMGGAVGVGLGVFKSGRDVVVCGGDAEFVMHMGGLATSGRYNSQTNRMIYIVFDNESNKSTGGQKTFQDNVDYLAVSKALGLSVYYNTIDNLDKFSEALNMLIRTTGINVVHVKCSYDNEAPRPPLTQIKKNTV